MKLSLIIPVFNEARQLQAVLENVFKVAYPCETEFIIVDDLSTDHSWRIIETFLGKKNLIAYRQPVNSGKGAAIQKGLSLATGDIVAIQDADFEYDPNDLIKLVTPILEDKADVVYGSRYKQTNPQVHRTFHYLVNQGLTLLSNMLSGLFLSDMETCYKVFRMDVLRSIPLESKRFGFEPEVTAKIAKLKLRVCEYAISYFPRNYQEGKKITWKDGISTLWCIFKYNFQRLSPQVQEKAPQKYLPTAAQWL